MIQLIEAGKTFKTHGLHGHLTIEVQEKFLKFIEAEKVLFFIIEGNAVPYFIEEDCDLEDGMIRLKEVNDPESAKLLSHIPFYIDGSRWKDEFIDESEQELDEDILGYTLLDATSSKSGRVIEVEEFPSQILLLVSIHDKLFYVPLREEWILDFKPQDKFIKMQLPEGMFE